MSREKQIEEISEILTEAEHKACEDIPFAPPNVDDRCIRPTMECHRCKEARALIDAGYRKQSGNTIELPCKVGDTIYLPWKWKDTSGVAILTVERMSITEAGCSIRTDLRSDDEDYWLAYNCGVFYFEEIGKTVFLIKEEAEKALSKMKGGE